MASGGSGIWHRTTIQMVRQDHSGAPSYHTASLAGNKRALEPLESVQVASGSSRPSTSYVLPPRPQALTASSISYVGGATAPTGPSVYSQRRALAATPSATADPVLSLTHPVYGLPAQLTRNLEGLGIRSIYPWQRQCLLGPGLLSGEKNLVYSAPTGGGKSLVADVLMLKRVLADRDAKALLVLPYVALVQEKVAWLRAVVQGVEREEDPGRRGREGRGDGDEKRTWRRRADENTIRVAAMYGGSRLRATWHDFDVAVCTMEKANALINTAIGDCSVGLLRAVVLDELHMIDDDHRGYILELLGTKLLSLENQVQIVGMSATLSNINLLAQWVNGHSYETRYRPIPIEEYLVHEGLVYPASTTSQMMQTVSQLAVLPSQPSQPSQQGLRGVRPPNSVKAVAASQHRELKDPVLNAVVALAVETAVSGYGALVFAGSRAICESDALLISRAMPAELDPAKVERRVELLNELRSLPIEVDRVLEQTVPYGVAFHHAGLTTEERELVATGFDTGVLKICIATCSLAAGVNLPARRVILHNARMGRNLVGPSMLRQMRGRAGRKGKDEVGETYLCCKQSDLEEVVHLMNADMPQVFSGLTTHRQRIQRALLEVIAIRLATSQESLNDYMSKSLLYHSKNADVIDGHVESSLKDLEAMDLISIDSDSSLRATMLGSAIIASGFSPEDGVFIHRELKKALQAFVMDGELHVLYTFSPPSEPSFEINWKVYRNEVDSLDESGHRVLRFLGLRPDVINNLALGGVLPQSTPEETELGRVYARFYLALQLRDLCNESPIHAVAKKYDVPRGAVQNLAQASEGFAAGMIKFCQYMNWGVMAAALDHFSDRLKAGARSDLLALAQITFVKSRTARVFWENGFKSVGAIANADPKELVPILMQAQPNKLRLKQKDEEKYEEKLLAKARVISDSANRLWQLEMQQDMEEDL